MFRRNAIAMMIWGGTPVFLAIGTLAAEQLLSILPIAAPVVVLAVFALGFACLTIAKWPQLRAGELFSFGPVPGSEQSSRLYVVAYILLAFGLCLALASLLHFR